MKLSESRKNSTLILLLNIGKSYKEGMGIEEVLNAVQQAWGKPSQDTEYALAIARYRVVGVFRISYWYKRPKSEHGRWRWAFKAEKAPLNICQKYENQEFRMYSRMEYRH